MKIKNLTKEELGTMSYKDLTYLLIDEEGAASINDLFKRIIELVELPSNTYESKIGDYYTSLSTDKRFILLNNGKWDLQVKHPKQTIELESDLDDLEEVDYEKEEDPIIQTDQDEINYDDDISDDTEEFKDLIIVDEDELDLEEN